METGVRRMVIVAALAAVAALAVGCASAPKPRVAVVRFTDTRDWIDPRIEKKNIFGAKRSIADWTTKVLAERIEKAGFAVTILSTDAAAVGADAVVSGAVYRWNIAVVKSLIHFDATATARGSVTVRKLDRVVLDKLYTGDATEVHASELYVVYDPSAQPLKKAARNMADKMASGVIEALKTQDSGPAKAQSSTGASKTP